METGRFFGGESPVFFWNILDRTLFSQYHCLWFIARFRQTVPFPSIWFNFLQSSRLWWTLFDGHPLSLHQVLGVPFSVLISAVSLQYGLPNTISVMLHASVWQKALAVLADNDVLHTVICISFRTPWSSHHFAHGDLHFVLPGSLPGSLPGALHTTIFPVAPWRWLSVRRVEMVSLGRILIVSSIAVGTEWALSGRLKICRTGGRLPVPKNSRPEEVREMAAFTAMHIYLLPVSLNLNKI